MSYSQYIKHSNNHRKDKYCQQCGFHFDDKTTSGSAIAENTAESFHVRDMKTNEILSENYPDVDLAVDFIRTIPDRWCGVYTDKGICLMK